MEKLFLRSMENKEKIIIFYMDRHNNVSKRIVRVLSMNQEYLVAYCYWRKKIRTFKLDNILSTGPISNHVGA
ncbi:WYL domain-containing protein [Ornithinibacillus sp. JPR2-1]|uniref:WYL domain-containing protein n=1 Tax=Ornithinibacillus sp. JPR2-1 TaxID=2094019 RepID=UPI0031DFBAA5